MRTVEEQVRDGTFVNIEGRGSIGILNVGEGDTKLIFDKNNPADCIRAARIIKDMLRRGYALMIAVEREGATTYQRVYEFREDTFEYVIADLDPEIAAVADKQEKTDADDESAAAPAPGESGPGRPRLKRGRPRKLVNATGAGVRAVAIPNRAGG